MLGSKYLSGKGLLLTSFLGGVLADKVAQRV